MPAKREYIILSEADAVRAVEALGALDLTKKWRVTVQSYVKKRTGDQNNLMWAWYSEIADHTGHSTDEIHEHCKAMFLKPKSITVNGQTTEYRTTTDLGTIEMSTYLERIRAWAHTNLGITLSAYGEAA